MAKASKCEEYSKDSSSADEGKEIAIISPANAIVDPYAMMVLRLNAVVTDSTMVAPRWAPYVARLAILDADVDGGS